MLISRDNWKAVEKALSRYLNIQINKRTSPMVLELLFNDKVLGVLNHIDDHIDNILSHVSNSNKNRVKKILYHMSSNVNKTIEFLNNPPDWARELIMDYFFSNIVGTRSTRDFRVSHDVMKNFIQYVPIYTILYRNGKIAKYVILYPSREELEKITPSIETESDFEQLLKYIIYNKCEIDFKNRRIRLYGFDLSLPLSGLINIGYRLDLPGNIILSAVIDETVSKLGDIRVEKNR